MPDPKGPNHYILDAHGNPVLERDLDAWAHWMDDDICKRRIAYTEIGETTISTVFLGIDHNFGDGDPILWETLIRSPNGDWETYRYKSRDAALEGHGWNCCWADMHSGMKPKTKMREK